MSGNNASDKTSPINKAFQQIAVRCVSHLREVSDAGAVLNPHDIIIVMDAIVKELGVLHFHGLEFP